jgi:hypothetical protein
MAHGFLWPFAINFSLGPDVSFRDEGEVDGAAEFAVSVANDPQQKWSSHREISVANWLRDGQRSSSCVGRNAGRRSLVAFGSIVPRHKCATRQGHL